MLYANELTLFSWFDSHSIVIIVVPKKISFTFTILKKGVNVKH